MNIAAIQNLSWYHNIELSPGNVTGGRENKNATITRALLRNADLRGKNCVDIGTMDAFYGFIMERKGAASVICADRQNRTPQVDTIKQHLGSSLQYVTNTPIHALRQNVKETFGQPADYVNFPGVLYHMHDPMTGLGQIRGMVRRGGLVLVDTPIFLSEESVMYYNHDGGLYTHTTFFLPTPKALQAMMARVGLFPIDARWGNPHPFGDKRRARLAVMCRAWNPTAPGVGENAASSDMAYLLDHALPESFIERQGVFTTDDARVVYTRGRTDLVGYDPKHAVDLNYYCFKREPTEYRDQDNILYLSDVG